MRIWILLLTKETRIWDRYQQILHGLSLSLQASIYERPQLLNLDGDPNPDTAFYFDKDPDAAFYSEQVRCPEMMRIQMRKTNLNLFLNF